MTVNWLPQTLLAMLFLVPAWLAIKFVGSNYGAKPAVVVIWYFVGVICSAVMFGVSPKSSLFPSAKVIIIMVVTGMTFGALANVLIFDAVAKAPNPGLPVAISSASNVLVFLCSALLAVWFPLHFKEIKFDVWSLLGVILTVIGTSIIAIRR